MKRVGKCDHKVVGGKMFRVRVVNDDSRLKEVRIFGDFFLHPEEALERIEGMAVESRGDMDVFQKELDEYLSGDDVEIYGADAREIRTAVETAINSVKS